jgi:hypothetical protein
VTRRESRGQRTEENNQVNDSSWRNLSALLGAACVVLIFAAGLLLATGGGSATPSQPAPSGSLSADVSANPSDSGAIDSGGPSDTPGATATPTPGPTATPPAKAPIAQITFNDMMMDASTAPSAMVRTFTFTTDGVGAIGISILKSSGGMVKICAKVDDSKWDCRTGTKVVYKGATTDTAHSLWTITMVGSAANTPVADLALSWPTNNARITLTHGRLQGSSSPGVPETLNGFSATFKSRAAGSVSVSAAWTLITTDVDVALSNVTGKTPVPVNSQQFTGAKNLGTPGYTYNVDANQFYKVTLRDISADSMKPDLTAAIAF